ncbi:Transmembrane protein 267 [Dissostichus eleginoides]|uniref:Transmembrane protein 267 n=1 Tax=Dissostichus eleginoides TaxID=100907 RepID=A0AAD9F0M5_DISEL|nr:Transmembrane protein 267 [Dissostichus eleginoides]
MQGFYSKLDAVPLLGAGGLGGEGAPLPLSLAVETEKAQALLQTFSSASLLASAGLGMFCVLADHGLQLSVIQNHLWLRAALDNATHGLVGLWSWAVVIGLRKKSDVYEVLLAGLLASIIDLDHFYMAGSLSLKVDPPPAEGSSACLRLEMCHIWEVCKKISYLAILYNKV